MRLSHIFLRELVFEPSSISKRYLHLVFCILRLKGSLKDHDPRILGPAIRKYLRALTSDTCMACTLCMYTACLWYVQRMPSAHQTYAKRIPQANKRRSLPHRRDYSPHTSVCLPTHPSIQTHAHIHASGTCASVLPGEDPRLRRERMIGATLHLDVARGF